MKIFVTSCDKNRDIFEPFHHCIEKYWPHHPEVIYNTETVENPYYKTICTDYPLNLWTKRTREALKQINDNKILLMADDCFIRRPVDIDRLDYACQHLGGNTASFNMEKSFDANDKETDLEGFKLRTKDSLYEVSLMCGLWDRNKLIEILERDCDPWTIETHQDSKSYDYYINSGDDIIDFGYVTWHPMGLRRGKWRREVVPFFEKEGIKVDYSIRGFDD